MGPFRYWQTSSSDDLLDADGDSLTVLNADGTPGQRLHTAS